MTAGPFKSAAEHRGIDPAFPEVRETPATSRWPSHGAGPPVPDEPLLAMASIQGNIVAGFNKDYQTLLYFHIDDAAAFKPAVSELGQRVATAEEVLTFNRLFKQVRDRRGYSGTLKSTWMNVAFSSAGLRKLTEPRSDADYFDDPSFRSGLAEQSAALVVSMDDDDPGNPCNWKVKDGDGDWAADVLIIVAADTENDVHTEVDRVTELLESHGATLVEYDEGKALPDELAGREHFGFLDGISQPGLRGRASADPTDVLTPRQNPDDPSQGKPGQELIWPGEFVHGYPGQVGSRDGHQRGGDSCLDGAGFPLVPEWAKDGSYLVFRRLKQDVFRFHQFLHAESERLHTSAEAVGARLVGRWPSGAPITRAPMEDDTNLADDDCANNFFWFQRSTEPIARSSEGLCPPDTFRPSLADPDGRMCPYTAHIRKANPRDDVEVAVRRTHRMLRRGIPFGEPSRSTPNAPEDDDVERGLLFVAYMTSIVRQFGFISDEWINSNDFPVNGAGTDALLGQPNWVALTGGGDYFSPSVSALKEVLSK